MSSTPSFRLRRNGIVIGPFASTQVRLMARRREILPTDELSLNGGQWVPVARTSLAAEVPSQKAAASSGASAASSAARKPASSVFFSQPLSETVDGKPKVGANDDTTLLQSSIAFPKASTGPVHVPRSTPVAPTPPPAPAEDDPLAGWDAPSAVAKAAPRRRPVRKSSSFGATEVFLILLAVAVFGGAIAAAFYVGYTRSHPPAAAAAPAAGAAAAPAPLSASAQAFVGKVYDLWYFQNATAPAMRLRLEANGSITVLQSTFPADEAATWEARWTLEKGALIFWSARNQPGHRFLDAQPTEPELVGTYFGKAWRKLTLVPQ